MRWWVTPVISALLGFLCARPAMARPEGIAAQGCFGCHKTGAEPTVTITSSSSAAMLGETVTLTVAITTTNGPLGGLYLRNNGKGTWALIAGEGTRLNADGVTHSAPKRAVGNQVTFRIGWTAPATAGGVSFNVWALSANGANGTSGDGGGQSYLSITYGCSGKTYYPDGDSDGYGSSVLEYTRDCIKPDYRVEDNTECNDYEAKIFPGQPEICNGKDDNCSGQIDEGLAIGPYYEDRDGDGRGGPSTKFVMWCGPSKGYGAGTADCNDDDPTIYPDAPEICNGKDDNCNLRIDEEAKVYCGEGWCRRAGEGCGTVVCTPGKPRVEVCNYFDDDCDGVIDNGVDICGKGLACQEGYCVPNPGGVGGASGGGPDAGLPIIDGDGGIGIGPGVSQGGASGCSVSSGAPLAGVALAALGLLLLAASLRRRAFSGPARGSSRRSTL